MPGLDHLLGAAVAGGLVTLAVTPACAWAARRLGVLDLPGGYKAHPTAVPLLGGLGVAAGTLAGILAALPSGAGGAAALTALGVGGGIILLAGLIDDVRSLPAHRKFAWQVTATVGAGLVAALLGVRLSLFLQWPAPALGLLTALWIVGVTNAVNFLDNMNGVCAGLAAVAAFALAAINARSGETLVALVAAALGGACLGFLPYNWPRARIFLGDTGSMFIGFLLAALAVLGVYTPGARVPGLAVFEPLVVLAVPLGDAGVVVLLRLAAGHPPWTGDRRHASHRLVRRGMRPAAAAATLWLAGLVCGLVAFLLPMAGAGEAAALLATLVLALGALEAVAGAEGLP